MTQVVGWWLVVAGAEAGLLAVGPPRMEGHPADAALAGLWLAVVVLGGYLVVVLGLGLLARLGRASAAVRCADRVTPRAVRAFLDRSLGVVAGGTLSMAMALGPPVTLRGLHPAPTTTTVVAGPALTAVVATAAHDPPPPPPPSPASPTWRVRRGDHFWSIAQRLLAEAWGRQPTAGEVTPYWRVLVDENQSRLADPANPDLLFAGQELTVPRPPSLK